MEKDEREDEKTFGWLPKEGEASGGEALTKVIEEKGPTGKQLIWRERKKKSHFGNRS